MKLWKMEKSCDFDHEKMNLVEKNVGTLAILARTLLQYIFSIHTWIIHVITLR
jgi:hypothetical protein